MSKKSSQRTEVISVGDLDVGGIIKNVKSGQALSKRYIVALKNSRPEKSGASWFDILVKAGALIERAVETETKPADKSAE